MIALDLGVLLALAVAPWAASVDERVDAWPCVDRGVTEDGSAFERPARPLESRARPQPEARGVRLSFELPTSAGDPIVLQSGGVEARLTIEDVEPGPWAVGGALRSSRSAAGDSLLVRASPGRVEDYRIVESPRPGPIARYGLELGAGVHVRSLEGVVELLDGSGTPRLRMARPYVLDAHGGRRRVEVALEGCAFDADPRPPWGRLPVEPGSARCELTLALAPGEAPPYPILLDPLWTATDELSEPRVTRAVVLGDSGRVLLAGGRSDAGNLATCEVFDEASGTFAVTSSLPSPRTGVASEWVESTGVALITGGCVGDEATCSPSTSALVFEPALGVWREVGPLTAARAGHRAIAVAGGRVMVIGGVEQGDPGSAALLTTELFEPSTELFEPGPPLDRGTHLFGASALADGGVVVVGGRELVGGDELAIVRRFDPSASSWVALPDLPAGRRSATVLELPDGRLAVAGGSIFVTPLRSTVVLEPSGTWVSSGSLGTDHDGGSAGLLSNGWLFFAGGADTSEVETMRVGESAVDASWSMVEPLPTARSSAAHARLPSGRWLLAGGWAHYDHDALSSAVLLSLDDAGASCAIGGTCATGHCVDGVCCDEACDGACVACSVAAGARFDGVCGALAEGEADPVGCVDQGPCGTTGLCGEDGACARYAAGALCDCGDGAVGACDGEGTCACAGGTCVDDKTERSEAGELIDCAPYRCAAGSCVEQCSRSEECVPGAVCDRDRRCVEVEEVPAAVVACACSAPGGRRTGLLPLLGLLCALAGRRVTRTSGRA